MLRPRIIACLDVAGNEVVKGIQFGSLRALGRPEELAARYEDEGADEIVLLDITAGAERRGPDLAVVERTARRLGIPLTVGGGIQAAETARVVLAAGADKVSVNSAALRTPALVGQIAEQAGSQAVVVAVDVRQEPGGHRVYASGGRTATSWWLGPWVAEVAARGAGEVLLTSIDRDGTGQGYDVGALGQAAAAARLPLIASGGGATAHHVAQALAVPGVTGALLAGVLHRGEVTLAALKDALRSQGVWVRVGS